MSDAVLTFDNPNSVTFTVNRETRTLRGLALPFGVAARDSSGGGPWLFDADSRLTWDRSKLLDGHEWRSLVGTSGFATTEEGVEFVAKVARTTKGDEILALATPDEDYPDHGAALDGVSVGFANQGFEFEPRDGFNYVTAAHITELSVTPTPAFTGAQIRSVAASAPTTTQKGTTMTETITPPEAPVSFSKADGDKLMADVQAISEKLAEFESIKIPVGPATFEVKEEPIYRFSGTELAPSGFDFATDLLAAGKDGDKAALERIQKFTALHLGPQFVDSGDTSNVNAPVYRPDMFLGQAPTPASPLHDFFYKGALKDITPFFWSKLDRTATTVDVANHTEDVDPTDDDLVTVVGVTVTPTPVSGKVHITREVGDQGGNPQVSALVWAEFERSFKIALETKTAALINAATVAELGAVITAGSTDGGAAGAIVEAGLVGLQFIPDGFRFQRAFGHVDLYKLLAAATKGTNNLDKIYPIINPQNSSGQAGSKWSYLDIGGYSMQPAASLGATNVNQKSYVADPTAVHIWNSGLQRLDKLSETVAGWDMGVFAYFAGVVYDASGLRKITYDVTA